MKIWTLMSRRSFVPLTSTYVRFVAVGGVAAVGYFSICYGLQEAVGWTPFWASSTAYAIMFGFAYLGQRNFAFRSTRRHRESLPAYLLLQVTCALLSAAIVQLLVTTTGQPPLVASTIATIMAGAASYLVSTTLIFLDHGAARGSAESSPVGTPTSADPYVPDEPSKSNPATN